MKIDINSFKNHVIFFGFCPGADFSRRLDTRWKELGICEFYYFDSPMQVKRFATIVPGDLIVLKKRQVIGKSMRVYGFGLVTGITQDKDGHRVLNVDWSSQDQVIEVPLLGCNSTIDIRTIEKVRAEMPNEFFQWLNQIDSISKPSELTPETESNDLDDNEIDEESSEQELLAAANRGNVDAMEYLGAGYANGEWGNEDLVKSFEWYLKAAENGSELGMFNSANYLVQGEVVEHNMELALLFLNKLAIESDYSADANYNLGIIYENGFGLDKNIEKAKEFYIKASELGINEADEAIARIDNQYQAEDADEVILEMSAEYFFAKLGAVEASKLFTNEEDELLSSDNGNNEEFEFDIGSAAISGNASDQALINKYFEDKQEDLQTLAFSFLFIGNHIGEASGKMTVKERVTAINEAATIAEAGGDEESQSSKSALFQATYSIVKLGKIGRVVDGVATSSFYERYNADPRTTDQGFRDVIAILDKYSEVIGPTAVQHSTFFLQSILKIGKAIIEGIDASENDKRLRRNALQSLESMVMKFINNHIISKSSNSANYFQHKQADFQTLAFSLLWVGNHIGEAAGGMSVKERMSALNACDEILASNADTSDKELFIAALMVVGGDSAQSLIDAYNADPRSTEQGLKDTARILAEFSGSGQSGAAEQSTFFLNALVKMAQAVIDESEVSAADMKARHKAADFIKDLGDVKKKDTKANKQIKQNENLGKTTPKTNNVNSSKTNNSKSSGCTPFLTISGLLFFTVLVLVIGLWQRRDSTNQPDLNQETASNEMSRDSTSKSDVNSTNLAEPPVVDPIVMDGQDNERNASEIDQAALGLQDNELSAAEIELAKAKRDLLLEERALMEEQRLSTSRNNNPDMKENVAPSSDKECQYTLSSPLVCESRKDQPEICSWNYTICGSPRLLKKLSKTSCNNRIAMDIKNSQIILTEGCRAQFVPEIK